MAPKKKSTISEVNAILLNALFKIHITQELDFITLTSVNDEESAYEDDVVTVVFHSSTDWSGKTGQDNADALYAHLLKQEWILSWEEQDSKATALKVDLTLIMDALPELADDSTETTQAEAPVVVEKKRRPEVKPPKSMAGPKKKKAAKSNGESLPPVAKEPKPKKEKVVKAPAESSVSFGVVDDIPSIEWELMTPKYEIKDPKAVRRRLRNLRDFVSQHAGNNPDEDFFFSAMILVTPDNKTAQIISSYDKDKDPFLSFALNGTDPDLINIVNFRAILMVELGFKE